MNNIFNTDDFTLYCFCNAEAENDFLNPNKKLKIQYIKRIIKEKLIGALIKISIPYILHFSYNFTMSDAITLYIFNHRVTRFTRYGLKA